MAQTPLTNIGLNYEWTLAGDDWKTGMDRNLVLMDSLGQGHAIDVRVAEPGSPDAGFTYILGSASKTGTNWSSDAGAVTDAVAVYVGDTGAEWLYQTPREGWLLYDRSADVWRQFNGTRWEANGHLVAPYLSSQGATVGMVHQGGIIEADVAGLSGDVTITVPNDATDLLPIGYQVTVIRNAGTGGDDVLFDTTATGLTVANIASLTADWARLTLLKRASNDWVGI